MMEFAIWVLLGGALGWLGFAIAGFSADWGLWISVIIGAAGALTGGTLLGPVVGSATVQTGDFDPFLLLTASAVSAGFLIVGNMIYNRTRG